MSDQNEEEPLELFQGHVKVEEVNGETVLKLKIPKLFEGHTFCRHFVNPKVPEPNSTEPFIIKFVLTSEFLIFQDNIDLRKIQEGFSYVAMDEKVSSAEIALEYITDDQKVQDSKEAKIRFGAENGILRNIIFEVHESNEREALKYANQFVSQIIDSICFQIRVPIQIKNIDITRGYPTREFKKYITQPYSVRKITEHTLQETSKTPKMLIPLLRLYREAINSSKVHYKLLCLYRLREGLEKVKMKNNIVMKDMGVEISRPIRYVSSNDLTKKFFPELIGKKIGAFLDHIRTRFRVNIAHFNFNEFDQLMLDPALTSIVHLIDAANVVLEMQMHQSIQDEWALMDKHGLLESTYEE